MSDQTNHQQDPSQKTRFHIVLGIGIGTVCGMAFGNVPLGIAIGAMIGLLLGITRSQHDV